MVLSRERARSLNLVLTSTHSARSALFDTFGRYGYAPLSLVLSATLARSGYSVLFPVMAPLAMVLAILMARSSRLVLSKHMARSREMVLSLLLATLSLSDTH